MYEILDSRWFSAMNAHIGVVAVHTGMHDPEKGEWKAYMGVAMGYNVENDEQLIAAIGAGLSPQEASGFFPHLDIAQYKKDE